MKTVTVSGKVYQLNTVYEDENGSAGFLRTVDTNGLFELNMNNKTWHCEAIEKALFGLGTIEDAPLELEDGEWYMCDLESGAAPLLWDKDSLSWLYSDGGVFIETSASVIALYKMIKG